MEKLNLTELQYVLFDWDNTLAESRTALVATVNQVLSEYGLPSWEVSSRKRDRNLSFRDNFPNIFGPEKAAEAYRRYAELYLQNVPSMISTFPGVKETLSFFHDRGIPMIIMTNKDRRLLEFELPLLFAPALFARIVAGHEAPRDKPYPEHAFYSLRGLLKPEDFSPRKVWIVGDSPQDSTAALDAGALPIRVHRSIWDDEAPSAGNIMYFSDFKALLNALRLAKN